ncbi:HSP90 family protein [Catellatospora citrea]|uniref:Molecular chaperone HtpG n=1 Tax=Catellatospora citrea TaxID=53366 RepID=A0A8J3KKE0_9ACTN|nr:HSP90 family protein [Catellatospora citrea]RKE06629.1 molecular chaperone HtpG [Catellatospora citrea]GIF98625.1 molecular chaperone HtpG [Catellatospora citrea]
MSYTFHVDLRGIVDLLSHHLYASPRVYVRELMQNAVDAITAVRTTRPEHAGSIEISTPREPGQPLTITDNGIGLTEPQVHELLATIGRSSKRDDLGFARHEFLGQFGIGLLSCFLVADTIEVRTRCGDQPTVEWLGSSDGSYRVRVLDGADALAEPGTVVTLQPRHGAQEWLLPQTVRELAGLYGSMLPIGVRVDGEPVSTGLAPWETGDGEARVARRARLLSYAEDAFGFTPFDVIDLHVAEAGLRGVAFVLPMPSNPAARVAHRVYLKQMLLSESVEGLLPEWAFFVRCVIDTTELRPTASREALYDDALLAQVRESLGDQLRGWMTRLGAVDEAKLQHFLRIHHLGVKALAVHDDDMLRLVEQWWPFETTVGPMTLAQFRDTYGVVRFVPSLDEFRQIAAVASAQGLAVVNGGYVYDAELLSRLPALDEKITIEALSASDLSTRLEELAPDEELRLRAFLVGAQRALDRFGVEVLIRAFDPAGLPALYLLDGDTALHLDMQRGQEDVDDVWASILGSFTAGRTDRPQLVLNHRNPLIRQAGTVTDPDLTVLVMEGLYVQALLLGRQPLRPVDTAALNQSFLGLLGRAMHGGAA